MYQIIVETVDGKEIANNEFANEEEFKEAHAEWTKKQDNILDSLHGLFAIKIRSLRKEMQYVPFDTTLIYR